jgi:predicted secreted hydrolase
MPSGNMRAQTPPKLSVETGHLDMSYHSGAGQVVWRSCRDERDRLMPYTYDVSLVGTDARGDAMRVDLHVTPSRPPVPLGAAAYNGKIACFGQDGTYSYFQTRMAMTGTLHWGAVREKVIGSAGHIDRQWFPLVANSGGPTGDIRSRAHEWRTINLDNGIDLSIWRQFDRTNGNALQPFSGATTSCPDGEPGYADDIEVSVHSYVRWPESVRPLVPPPVAVRYMPDRHRLTSRTLDFDLTGEPLVAAPAHALPIEYMEGPYRYRGTYGGKPVSGFAFYERSLALYRDWELAEIADAHV